MSGNPEELARLACELRSWVRQQGVEWLLAPGAEAPAARGAGAAMAGPSEIVPAPEGPPAARIEPAAATTIAPAPPAAAPRRPADVEFERSCRIFVEQALAQLRRQATARQPAVAPRQQDFFATPGDEPEAPAQLSRPEKEAALAELCAQVAGCTRCKLHASRTQGVFGVGSADAKLVFIGEAPGRDEDRQGEPFVGRAGKLLTDIMRAIGFTRDQVYICNILKSRPPENRDPEPDEVEACEPYLQRQLQIIQPKLICCLGRVAAQNLLKTRASLGALRDGVHFYEGVPVVVTYHPAALLRNPHWKRPTWDDVRRLRALHDALAGEPPAR